MSKRALVPPHKSRSAASPTPREIFGYLDQFVVGQERAKRAVAIAAYNHVKRCAQPKDKRVIKKSNLLLIGPTGCGKTHIARNLADCLKVPFIVADATEYTEAGYYGKDVEVMVAELLFKSGHSIEDTQRGIVFIDEIDKIARRSQGARNGAGSRDIGGEGVQQSLLKLLEGRELFVPLNVTQHWNKHDFVQVDTQRHLVHRGRHLQRSGHVRRRRQDHRHRLGTEGRDKKKPRVTSKELSDYGMLPELLGRLPVIVQLDPLDETQLVDVLCGPPDSIVREYQALLAADEVKLEFADAALREIVRFAVARRVGARGLRGIVEEVCHDLMFEAPERRGETVMVDADWVRERLAQVER